MLKCWNPTRVRRAVAWGALWAVDMAQGEMLESKNVRGVVETETMTCKA